MSKKPTLAELKAEYKHLLTLEKKSAALSTEADGADDEVSALEQEIADLTNSSKDPKTSEAKRRQQAHALVDLQCELNDKKTVLKQTQKKLEEICDKQDKVTDKTIKRIDQAFLDLLVEKEVIKRKKGPWDEPGWVINDFDKPPHKEYKEGGGSRIYCGEFYAAMYDEGFQRVLKNDNTASMLTIVCEHISTTKEWPRTDIYSSAENDAKYLAARCRDLGIHTEIENRGGDIYKRGRTLHDYEMTYSVMDLFKALAKEEKTAHSDQVGHAKYGKAVHQH